MVEKNEKTDVFTPEERADLKILVSNTKILVAYYVIIEKKLKEIENKLDDISKIKTVTQNIKNKVDLIEEDLYTIKKKVI